MLPNRSSIASILTRGLKEEPLLDIVLLGESRICQSSLFIILINEIVDDST